MQTMARKSEQSFRVARGEARAKAIQHFTSGGGGVGFLNDGVDIKMFRPHDGENIIRIVPPVVEDNENVDCFGLIVWRGWVGGRSIIDPRVFDKNARNPLFEAMQMLNDRGIEADTLKSVPRVLVFIIDYTKDDRGSDLMLWDAPQQVIKNIIDVSLIRTGKNKGEYIVIEDPDEGHIVFFDKTGKDVQTKYSGFTIDENTIPLPDDIVVPRFEDIINVLPEEELDKLADNEVKRLLGKNDDSDEPASGRRSRFGGRSRSSSRDRDEESDDDSEESGRDSDAVGRRPTRSTRITARSKSTDSGDDDNASDTKEDIVSRVKRRLENRADS